MNSKLNSNAIGQPVPLTSTGRSSAERNPDCSVTSIGTVKVWKKTERTILRCVTCPAFALTFLSAAGGLSFGLAGMLTMPILAAVAIGGTASSIVLLVSGLICLLADLRLLSSLQKNPDTVTARGPNGRQGSEAYRTNTAAHNRRVETTDESTLTELVEEPTSSKKLATEQLAGITFTTTPEKEATDLELQQYELVSQYIAEPAYDEELKELRSLADEENQRIVTIGNQMKSQLLEIKGLVEDGKLYKNLVVTLSDGVTKKLTDLGQVSETIQGSLSEFKTEQEKLQLERQELNERKAMLAEEAAAIDAERLQQKASNDENKLTIKRLREEIKQKEAQLTSSTSLNDTFRVSLATYQAMLNDKGSIGARHSATGGSASISSATSSRENSPSSVGKNDNVVSGSPTPSNGSLESDVETDMLLEDSSSDRTGEMLEGPKEDESEEEVDNLDYIIQLEQLSLSKNNAKKADVVEASNDGVPTQSDSQSSSILSYLFPN